MEFYRLCSDENRGDDYNCGTEQILLSPTNTPRILLQRRSIGERLQQRIRFLNVRTT